jgi:hypothetical protein
MRAQVFMRPNAANHTRPHHRPSLYLGKGKGWPSVVADMETCLQYHPNLQAMNILDPRMPEFVRSPCCGRYAFKKDAPKMCVKCGNHPYMELQRSMAIFYRNFQRSIMGINPTYPDHQ